MVVGTTGVIFKLFFKTHTLEEIHGWLGLAMVAGAVFHIAQNWPSLRRHFTDWRVFTLLAPILIVIAFFAFGQKGEGGQGINPRIVVHKLLQARAGDVARAMGRNPDGVFTAMKADGLRVGGIDETIEQLAANNGRQPDGILTYSSAISVAAVDTGGWSRHSALTHHHRTPAMKPHRLAALATVMLVVTGMGPAMANDLSCVNTAFRVVGADDKVCVSVFEDPKVPGIACYIGQARTGGVKGSFGLAEDPSRFSLTCLQVGPVTTDFGTLKDRESVYSEHTSIFFKHTKVYRVLDVQRNTLVYLAISDKVIDGSPENALASVTIKPWAGK